MTKDPVRITWSFLFFLLLPLSSSQAAGERVFLPPDLFRVDYCIDEGEIVSAEVADEINRIGAAAAPSTPMIVPIALINVPRITSTGPTAATIIPMVTIHLRVASSMFKNL